jgi:hypothetical protein
MTAQTASHRRPTEGGTSDAGRTTAGVGSGQASRLKRKARLLPQPRAELIPVSELVPSDLAQAFLRAKIRAISPVFSSAAITQVPVPLADIRPLSRVAERSRYGLAKRLVRLMRRRRCTLFEPCLVRYDGEQAFRLTFPPLVEETQQGLVIIDGVHRLAVLAKSRRSPRFVTVIMITRAWPARPAAVPGALSDIAIEEKDRPREQKFRHLKPSRFRPAGATLRGPRFSFDTPEAFVAACEIAARVEQRNP